MALIPRQHRIILTCAMVCAVLGTTLSVTPVYGAPASKQSEIEAKKAEEAEANQLLEQMRLDLAVQVSEYVELGKQIERTRAEIAQSTVDLTRAETELSRSEQALNDRVGELYRGDRLDLLHMVLSARSLQDLWVRAGYLATITRRDAFLLNEVRLARTEALWLREGLLRKADRLAEMQVQADEARIRIEDDLEMQSRRAEQLRVDLARLMWSPSGGSAPDGAFNPETVIAEETYRNATAMTLEQVQAFLAEQPGTLATYSAPNHKGKTMTAAEMIVEAANAWGVNPAVIMATLQKEQSLLERANPKQSAYEWAMGCGRPDSGARYTQYQGFGKQIWFGAQKLAKNGERWKPGISMKIDGSTIHPTNAATYSLFKYTPHFRGTMSFWMLYWRYFGDPSV